MTELNEPALPKTGRVNEVCREWVVREDNALAHQLQSQEINEHYRGNRFRNQVVRQDFPTALSEQIKEKEVADEQTARYHEMTQAQAEADALVAQTLAENLRHEQELERRRNIERNEYLARKLHDELHVSSTPPSARPKPIQVLAEPAIVNELPIPPKSAHIKYNGHGQRRSFIENEMVTNPSYVIGSQTHSKDSPHLNYVSLELNVPKDSQKRLANHHATQYTQVIAHNGQNYPSPLHSPSEDSDSHHYEHINLHSHTPEKKTNPQPYNAQNDYNFPTPVMALPPKPVNQSTSPSKFLSKPAPALPPKSKDSSRGLQMLTTDSFDMLMGNGNSREANDECDSLAAGGVDPTRSNERIFNSNAPTINRIDSMDDILVYEEEGAAAAGPSCSDRIRQMQELGVPPEEILEIDRRLTQQEKDEELARRLQEEEERQTMSIEEMDRLVAIEAQDKELAKMLQEREKAKARRAKERARARKQQQLQQERMQLEPDAASIMESSQISHSRSHSDSNDIEHDSYSDPIDLVTARENAMHSYQSGEYLHSKQSSGASRDSLFQNEENYSNPIDSLRTAQMSDSNHNVSPSRPGRQHIKKSSNSIDKLDSIISTTVDPTFPNTGSNATNQPITNSSHDAQNFLPAHLKYMTPDQNSNPIPPYMPIQGIRRANGVSPSDKKKKSKDNRCTQS